MNVLYLSPHFPPNYRNFPVRLKEAGATVVGIGWAPYEQLTAEVQRSLTEYCHVADMENYEHVLRAAAFLVSRVGRLDRVAAQEEHWIDLEAALRLDFNVPGPRPEDIKHFRHKSLMKRIFRNASIPCADGALLDNPESARALARRVGFPLIAKPDKGVGAHATCKLSSEKELAEFLLGERSAPYILEEFLEGQIESFDGLTDAAGRIVFCTCHRFSTPIMNAVNDDDHLHYWSLRRIPPETEELGRKAVAAFGLKERFFHLEFIRSPAGKLRAMEINARPPGGLTTDMFNFANDIDVYREWANLVVHGRFDASWTRPYHVSYIGRKDRMPYLHSHEDILREHGQAILMHTPIDSVFRKAIGDYAYLARETDLEALWPIADYIQRLAP